MKYEVFEGDYAKLGIQVKKDGVIFTFEGEREESCAVLLHDEVSGEDCLVEVPQEFCRGALRSVYIKGINRASTGYLFVRNGKEFMDPYAYAIMGRDIYCDHSRKAVEYKVYGRIAEPKFRGRAVHHLEVAKTDMFVYKLHVRGFTMDSGVRGAAKGTFAGLEAKLPYIKELGVTTVELMPCYEYEEFELAMPEPSLYSKKKPEIICKKKPNYWGYKEGQYFAVKASYAKNPKKAEEEFAHLINKLHEAGMECVMEMYFPDEMDQNLILQALLFWVDYYQVDGFHLIGNNIPLQAIVQNAFLARTKIFYSYFPEELLKQDRRYKRLYVASDEYLYPARQMLNHINGNMEQFINQQKKQSADVGFINYLASNNGFTYMDSLMYNDRHNEANGEGNFDGSSYNFSHNYGHEGPTTKKVVVELRKRQWKNGMAMLFLAQGVPMLMAGDEFGNSKKGNNNSYCQDNEIGWVNWKEQRKHKEEIDFVKTLAALRKQHQVIVNDRPFSFMDRKFIGIPDLSFHGKNAWITGVTGDMLGIGLLYAGDYAREREGDVFVAYNFYASETSLAIPRVSKYKWECIFKTGQVEFEEKQKLIKLEGHSICVLTNEKEKLGK